jgi:gliding motility-associated-like protein
MLLKIEVTNCINPPNFQGVQLQVYEAAFASCDLFALTPVGNCIETTTSDSTQINMVPGHVYYIFIDGFQGDNCEYKLRVLGKIECPSPQPTLSGPTTVSAGQAATYTVTFPPDNCPYENNNPCGNVKQDTVTCSGQCTSGTAGFTYTWTGPSGSTVIGSGPSVDISFGSQSGNVTVIITGPCYYRVLSLFVSICTAQAPGLQPDYSAACYGIVEVYVQGNYTSYQWSNGDSGNPGSTNNPGSFAVTVTDAQGCAATANIFVNFPPIPFVQISGPTSIICPDLPATLTANAVGGGQYVYQWSNGTSNSNSISVATAGNYQVTVTNPFGCTAMASYPVNFYPTVAPTNLPPLNLCQEQLPYVFYGSEINNTGTYTVFLSNFNGCDSLISQPITVQPPVVANISSSAGQILANGETTMLTVNGSTGIYDWSEQSNSQSLIVDQPGTYSVTVTAPTGCTATASITITQASLNCPNFNLPIAPADSCATAPSFCGAYLAGFCSENDGYTPDVPGNLASVIPCTIENNQWLKFTACDTAAWFELSVNNCQSGLGLQFAVLQTADCQSFTTNSSCFNIANGNTDTLFANNLMAGQTYYLMIDGITADICDWQVISTFGVSEGAVYQAENTPGDVIPVDPTTTESCGGAMVPFTFIPPVCNELTLVSGCPAEQQLCTPHMDTCISVVRYDTVWHVTPYGWGAVFENNDSLGSVVNIIFPTSPPPGQAGADSLIFTIAVEFVAVALDTLLCWNDCLVECANILPPTQPCVIRPRNFKVCFPQNIFEQYLVCVGECVTTMGQTFCNPGTYTISSPGVCGCTNTTTIYIDWQFDPPPFISQPEYVCSPDATTYTVGFNIIQSPGSIFVLVNGQPFNGGTYTSAPIPSGQSYSFLIEAVGSCGVSQPMLVSGTHTCQPCIGGTNNLGAIALCPNECYELLGNSYCSPGSYSELLYNPATNCNETYQFELTQIVEPALAVGTVSRFCDATNLYYQVGFPIESGTPPYSVNGNLISGNFYQSGLIPTGQPYAFTVTDAAVCAPQQVNIAGTYTCNCINNPGSTQYATLYACDDNMVSVQFNNDAVVGPGDLLVFILHTDNGASLGQVVGMNTTGTFGFVPGSMTYGQTYRISPAVGPDMGGTVDMNASCFQFAAGQPVVFYEKPATEILPHDSLNCFNNSLTISSLTLQGSGDYAYGWSGTGNFVSTAQNATVTQPGAYALLVTDNLTGCTAQAATAVEADYTTPDFTLTDGEINCQQAFATLEAASQMPGVSYTWTFPTGDQMTGAMISTNVPGSYAVTAQGTNGCTSDGTTFVEDNGIPPSLEVEDGVINCAQSSATLSALSNDPTAVFTWTWPDGSQAVGPTITVDLPGVYSVSVLTQSGCSEEGDAVVSQGPDPVLIASLEATPPTCFGYSDGSIQIMEGNGGLAPIMYSIEGLGTGISYQNLPAGNYLLQIEDLNGCRGDSLVLLTEPHEITVDLGDDRFTSPGAPVELSLQTSTTPQTIVWTGPNGENWQGVTALTVAPRVTGQYAVVVSDENGCQATDDVMVIVEGGADAYLPTAFSPNGDNQNDRFTVFAGGEVKQVTYLQVFDRWGEMVFEAHDFAPNDNLNFGWDGRYKGRALDPALFVAMAEVEFVDGTRKALTGEVVLVK